MLTHAYQTSEKMNEKNWHSRAVNKTNYTFFKMTIDNHNDTYEKSDEIHVFSGEIETKCTYSFYNSNYMWYVMIDWETKTITTFQV